MNVLLVIDSILMLLGLCILGTPGQTTSRTMTETVPGEIENINELDFQVIDRATGKKLSQETIQHLELIRLKLDSMREVDRVLRDSRFRSKPIKYTLYYAPIEILPAHLFASYHEEYIGEISVNPIEGYPDIKRDDFYPHSSPWLAFERNSDGLTVHVDATYYRFILDASVNQEIQDRFLSDFYPDVACLYKLQDEYPYLKREIQDRPVTAGIPYCMPENFIVPFLDFYDTLRGGRSDIVAFRPNNIWVECAHKAEQQYGDRYIKLTQDFIQRKKSKTVFSRIICD